MRGDLQYLSDCLVIEKLVRLDRFYKRAESNGLLGNLAESIVNWAKTHVDTSNGIQGVTSSLFDIMVPGVLFKINPILGGLATVAQVLGFNPSSVIKSMLDFVIKNLQNGTMPTLQELNNVGKEAVSAEAGGELESSASLLEYLHQYNDSGKLFRLVKQADLSDVTRPDIPFFGGQGNLIEKVFGQLFKLKAKNKAKWLLGGFIVWIVKTVLLGAGLLAAGEAVKSMIGSKSKTEPNETPVTPVTPVTPEAKSEVQNVHHNLTPTGRGQDFHENDHQSSTWVVPVLGNSVENTLVEWAGDVYHELQNKEHLMLSNPAFIQVAGKLKQHENSNQITMPPEFKSRKQVVDSFAESVFNQ